MQTKARTKTPPSGGRRGRVGEGGEGKGGLLKARRLLGRNLPARSGLFTESQVKAGPNRIPPPPSRLPFPHGARNSHLTPREAGSRAWLGPPGLPPLIQAPTGTLPTLAARGAPRSQGLCQPWPPPTFLMHGQIVLAQCSVLPFPEDGQPAALSAPRVPGRNGPGFSRLVLLI